MLIACKPGNGTSRAGMHELARLAGQGGRNVPALPYWRQGRSGLQEAGGLDADMDRVARHIGKRNILDIDNRDRVGGGSGANRSTLPPPTKMAGTGAAQWYGVGKFERGKDERYNKGDILIDA